MRFEVGPENKEDMMQLKKKYQMTLEGHQNLQSELEELCKEKIKTLAELKEAKDEGDLSENAGYDEARKRLSFVEGRIVEIEDILSNVEIVKKAASSIVRIGTSVLVENDNKEEIRFQIVTSTESDAMENKISDESPLGKSLLNHKAGDKIEFSSPAGKHRYLIKSID